MSFAWIKNPFPQVTFAQVTLHFKVFCPKVLSIAIDKDDQFGKVFILIENFP